MPNKYPSITREMLTEIFDYNPETGSITWAKKIAPRIYVGEEAGQLIRGYRAITLKRHRYFAHRLIWVYMTGNWPDNQIDHINHIRDDNRWVNLREANNQENARNNGLQRNNSSGFTGVVWNKTSKAWCARIIVSGERIHLGVFKEKSKAALARKAAEIKYDFHPNHGKLVLTGES